MDLGSVAENALAWELACLERVCHRERQRDIARAAQKRKGPSSVSLKGPVNPAATYSPGPGGQVPSAI